MLVKNSPSRSGANSTVWIRMGVLTGEDDSSLFVAGDGFPLVPVTSLKIRQMLACTTRKPKELLGKCPPSYNEVTVEKVAAVAVLAGCKPEYVNVVLSAVECMLEKDYNLHGVHATTMGATPCIIVNGPVRNECSLNCHTGALGSGSRANACIGRTVKLVLKVIGKAELGGTESTTLGTPMKYTFCVSENEHLLNEINNEYGDKMDWKPLQNRSSVTMVTVTSGPHQVTDFLERSADGVVDLLARSMVTSYNWYAPFINECILFLSPEHIRTLSAGGVRSKEDLANRLWRRCNILFVSAYAAIIRTQLPNLPILAFFIGNFLRLIGSLANLLGFGGLGKVLPKFNSPRSLYIVVTGGEAGKFSSFCPGFGVGKPGMPTYGLSKGVTKPVQDSLTASQVLNRFEELKVEKFAPIIDEIYLGNTKKKESFPISARSGISDMKGTIGLVDISKPMGSIFLDRMQERFEKQFPMLQVKRYCKETFSRPAKKSLVDKITSECDYVIQALAD